MFISAAADSTLRQNQLAHRGDIIQDRKNMIYGRRRFVVADQSFWNSRPVDIHRRPSLTDMKSKLKTLLFRGAN